MSFFFHTFFQSEKLLGDLGGLFSKKWKPKKNGTIKGPMISRGNFHYHLKLDSKMTKRNLYCVVLAMVLVV